MPTNVSILSIRSRDIRRILEIQNECGLSVWSHQDYLDEIGRNDSICMRAVESRSDCVGFLVGRRILGDQNAVDLEIYNIGVDPAFQRSGIGSLMITELLAICRLEQIAQIWLDVRASNLKAQRFYGKHGFGIFGQRPGFYTDPEEASYTMRLTMRSETLTIS